MKNLISCFILAVFTSTSINAQGLDQKSFFPEIAARNGYQGHQPKVPDVNNLIGVWKRVASVVYMMGDPHVSDEPLFADTITFVRIQDGRLGAVFIKGDRKATIVDVQFIDVKGRYESRDHYSMEGTAKTQDDQDFNEIDFHEIDYPRMANYPMTAISRVTSLDDKYLVLEFESNEKEFDLKTTFHEGFVKMEKGVVIPTIDKSAYEPRDRNYQPVYYYHAH